MRTNKLAAAVLCAAASWVSVASAWTDDLNLYPWHISASPDPAAADGPVTLHYSVRSRLPIPGIATFQVDGVVVPGCEAITLSGNSADCVVPSLTVGTHLIYGSHSGIASGHDSRVLEVLKTLPPEAPKPPASRARIGDFNGDGKADVLWPHADGSLHLWLMAPTGLESHHVLEPAGSAWRVAQVGDYNGDGRDDIAWQDAEGAVELRAMSGASVLNSNMWPVGAVLQGFADFNGGGRDDLLWKYATGDVWLLLSPLSHYKGGALGRLQPVGSQFEARHSGDFNGDGKADIVWQHPDGRTIVWLMDGMSYIASRTLQAIGSAWRVSFVADFDGDGRDDLAWEHPDGRTVLWLMDGTATKASRTVQSPGSTYRISHTGDFDGDGKADIVWLGAVYGNAVAWLMNGVDYTASRTLIPAGDAAGRSVAAVGDFNGDGRSDLLITDRNGLGEVQLMEGLYPIFGYGFDTAAPPLVGAPIPTTTTLAASANPSALGESVTFTATTAWASGPALGQVTFRANGVAIAGCIGLPTLGSATCTTSGLAAGPHAVRAEFMGTMVAASVSADLAMTVAKPVATVALQTSTPLPYLGQPVSLTATVAGAYGTPRGGVYFRDGGVAIAGCNPSTLMGGSASCHATGFGVGAHTISAMFYGDDTYGGSLSGLVGIEVSPVPMPRPKAANPWQQRFDFDGDRMDDLVWQHVAGDKSMFLMRGTQVAGAGLLATLEPEWRITHVDDFDGDGRSELLWRNDAGQIDMMQVNGTTVLAMTVKWPASAGYAVHRVADFNGDGRADIVLRHSDGRVEMAIMDGTTTVSTGVLQPAGSAFTIASTGDFNGDGKADILWRHPDGRVIAWLMDGPAWIQSKTLRASGSGWSVAHVGDLDGNGKSDIAWEHGDGRTELWIMDGVAMTGSSTPQPAGSAWRLAAMADLNGDGRTDLLWRNATYGNVVGWLMNGTAWTASRTLRGAGSGWSVERIRDFNGDLRSDIVWRHTYGEVALWLMDGLYPTGEALMGEAGWEPSP